MSPSFVIPGDPGVVRSKAAGLRSHGVSFVGVAEALDAVRTDGWVSLAADRFREKFGTESGKWRDAGQGFERAAGALETYAGALASAQGTAGWAAGEWARGDEVTRRARAAYDADVRAGQREKRESEAAGVPFTLTILPFADPGESVRAGAAAAFERAQADVKAAGEVAAEGVRAGCAGAPASRSWWESGLAFVGDVFVGIFEGVEGLAKLAMLPITQLQDLIGDIADLATGRLTPAELAAKYQLKAEDAAAFAKAVWEHPGDVALAIGKGILDWDTWADDPGKAIGHLIPQIVLTIATLGGGAAAVGVEDAAVAAERAAVGMEEGAAAVEDVARGASMLDDLGDLSRLGDEGGALADDLAREPFVPDLDQMTNAEKADLFGIDNPTQGQRVWRVFGEQQDGVGGLERGSRPFGESWTPQNPAESADFRWDAGLPDENPGRFVVEGVLRRPSYVTDVRPALPLDGNPGGWPEYLIRDAADAVDVRSVSGLNEPWTTAPGGWDPWVPEIGGGS